MKKVNWADGASKLIGELGTVRGVSGSGNSVKLETLVWPQREPLARLRAGKFDSCCGRVFLRTEPGRLSCQ